MTEEKDVPKIFDTHWRNKLALEHRITDVDVDKFWEGVRESGWVEDTEKNRVIAELMSYGADAIYFDASDIKKLEEGKMYVVSDEYATIITHKDRRLPKGILYERK